MLYSAKLEEETVIKEGDSGFPGVHDLKPSISGLKEQIAIGISILT
jgi:hypothetical protein